VYKKKRSTGTVKEPESWLYFLLNFMAYILKYLFRLHFARDAISTQIWSQCYGLHSKNKANPERDKVS
jgi:hypothetical protein